MRSYPKTSNVLPLPWTRLFLSTMTLVMSIVAGAVTVQLFIKGHKQKRFVNTHAPTGVQVHIDNDDIKNIGVGVLLASSLLSSAASNPLLFLLQDMFHVVPASLALPWGLRLPDVLLSTTTLPMQAWSMLVTNLAVIGTMVPFTLIARHHAAKVTATAAGVAIPAATLAQMEQALGVHSVYWDIQFIRVVAVAPWVSLLFSIPLMVVSFIALMRHSPKQVPGSMVVTPEMRDGAVAGSTEKV